MYLVTIPTFVWSAVRAVQVYELLLASQRPASIQHVSPNCSRQEVTQSPLRLVLSHLRCARVRMLIVVPRAVSTLLSEYVCPIVCTGLRLTFRKNMTEDDWRWHMYDTVRATRR